MRLLLALGLSLLAGCAQRPDTIAPRDYAFSAQSDTSPNRFRLTYFGPPEPPRRNMDPTPSPRQGVSGEAPESLPGQGNLISDHQLFTLLEQELDQRHLCLQGYRILSRRPTARGVTMEGQCLDATPAVNALPDRGLNDAAPRVKGVN
ncbi:hypothetical protein [Ferrimonas gelatinilytica]|uniref:Lipoprotein n=1 Tax=Ferrimonas gelatinilytica TaxID=1255257 RepID=A0ABP9S4D8_9GAMM